MNQENTQLDFVYQHERNQVQLKSPGLMLGYYKNEALTREAIDTDGFLHTGDRGTVDAEGYLHLTGRL